MLDFARALPQLRRRVQRDLGGEDLGPRARPGRAVRLLDIGFFRSRQRGLRGAERAHAVCPPSCASRSRSAMARIVFDYLAKGGQRQIQSVADPDIDAVVRRAQAAAGRQRAAAGLSRRPPLGRRGRRRDQRLPQAPAGGDFSAKDFRTWNATVLAAVALAAPAPHPTSRKGTRQRAITGPSSVAGFLGNTRPCAGPPTSTRAWSTATCPGGPFKERWTPWQGSRGARSGRPPRARARRGGNAGSDRRPALRRPRAGRGVIRRRRARDGRAAR